MVELDTILKNMQVLLSASSSFSDIHFVHAFTGLSKASPLNRPTVSLAVKSMEEKDVEPVYTKVDEAAGEIPELLYNHVVSVRLRLDIHVPQTVNGIECYEIYTRLSRFLMDMEFTLPFVGVGCEDLKYNRDMGAFTLYTYVDLKETSIV